MDRILQSNYCGRSIFYSISLIYQLSIHIDLIRIYSITVRRLCKKMARKKKKRFGFGADESAEKAEAEKMKSQSGSETITYEDRDSSTAGIETYDSKTGKKEGVITLGPQGNTGLLVPLEITEKIEAHYAFNEEEDIDMSDLKIVKDQNFDQDEPSLHKE